MSRRFQSVSFGALLLVAVMGGSGCIFGTGSDGGSGSGGNDTGVGDARTEKDGVSDVRADVSCEERDGFVAEEDGRKNQDAHCDGVDNDCDGVVDEGCPCTYEGQQGSDGVCEDARINANGTCARPPGYQAEEQACEMDDLDNDCDGDTDCNDEDCQQAPGVCL